MEMRDRNSLNSTTGSGGRKGKMLAFTGKGRQVFITAVSIIYPDKSVTKVSAIQVLLYNLFDMGAKEPESVFQFRAELIILMKKYRENILPCSMENIIFSFF
jgi:hypothetical protein